jgi:methylglutaconyl-CoA hydratase
MTLLLTENIEPGIQRITLNRVEKRNALSLELMWQMIALLQNDDAAYILTGSGTVFSSGLDLHEAVDSDAPERLLIELVGLIANRQVVAALNGPALAGGAAIVAACQMAVGSPSCTISYPASRRGLTAAIASEFLMQQVSDKTLRELMLMGSTIDSGSCVQKGLINKIVPKGNLEDAAINYARLLIC